MSLPICYQGPISDFDSVLTSFEKKWTNLYILVDENTKIDCLPRLLDSSKVLKEANLLVLDPGEDTKTIEIADSLWSSLLETGADRKSLIINLGGGVVTDLGGFVASTFKRGIDFIHIPTTLLGQVDAAIGGKTGVNLEYSKNQVGTFAHPLFVYTDSQFLKTLPERELISGLAEVVKYGLIADKSLFSLLKDKDSLIANLDVLISTSIKLKEEFVVADFKETGERKKLNFGHTIGHAVESYFMGDVLHGEAIALGMICESYISFQMEKITESELNEVVEMIFSFFEKIELETKMFDSLLDEMRADKKNEDGKLNFTLIIGIGESEINYFIDEKLVIESLNFYSTINNLKN